MTKSASIVDYQDIGMEKEVKLVLKHTFEVENLQIHDVKKINLNPFIDKRGLFTRTFDYDLFYQLGLPTHFQEEYESTNYKKYTVRGFHFQYPSQAKLIKVATGSVTFVALDLRNDSPTKGKWCQAELAEQDYSMLYVPKGFALCMCTLANNTRFYYKIDEKFNPNQYGCIRWNSPELGIPWPKEAPSNISKKDSLAQTFIEFENKYGGLNLK